MEWAVLFQELILSFSNPPCLKSQAEFDQRVLEVCSSMGDEKQHMTRSLCFWSAFRKEPGGLGFVIKITSSNINMKTT